MSSSWPSLSFPNPFKPPADDHSPPPSDAGDLTQSITRQLRGVASFLAPPPKQHSDEPPTSQTLTGIKNDLAEIGGSFKSSLSLLSSNKAVTEISRFASNLLQFENRIDGDEEEDGDEDVLGISDEVIDFVGEISLRPELWTEFPSSVKKEFDMSDVQKDHVSTIEQLVPSLTALRHKIESCMSKEQFWIIYFILLLPRLNDDDSELLSTPEIVEVRETLLQKLNSKHNTPVEVSGEHKSRNVAETGTDINNTQKMHPSSSSKHPSDNLYAQERILTQDHEDSEPSSSEEDVNIGTYGNTRNKRTENEDDISFSDLEDEDNDLSSRMSGNKTSSSPSQSGSIVWVQLKENSQNLGWLQKDRRSTDREKDSGSEDSNEWLTVDKIDSD